MNVYQLFTTVGVDLMIGTIGVLQTHSRGLDIYTETSQALAAAWTTDPHNNSQPAAALAQVLSGQVGMGDFITAYLNESWLYQMSTAFGVAIMTVLNTKNVWDNDKAPDGTSLGPTHMNIINQFLSLISSTGQQDQQSGQNETKSEDSQVQGDASAPQTVGDLIDLVNGAGGNLAGLLQQLF